MKKRFLSILLCFCMLFTLLPTSAFAAGSDQITIRVDVYDVSNNKIYENVGTDTVQKRDDMVQSEWYQIPPLSKFTTQKFGRVQKVTGNWFPTSYGSCNVGSNVQFSSNNSNARITYYVSYYQDDSGIDEGGGSNGDDTEDTGSGSKYQWKQTIVYHSNYPDGKDFQYKVVYNITSFTDVYNAFGILKTHEECGFTVPNIYALADKYWNEKKDGTGEAYKGKGTFYFEMSKRNTETHLYAQYVPKADELIYTLTYMNGSEMFRKGEYDPNTVVDITPDVPTQAASQNLSTARSGEKEFLGWDDSEEATTVDYEFGDTILIDQDKILYAVWGEKGPNKPDKPTEPELKVLLDGKIKVKDVYPLTEARHEDKTYGLLVDGSKSANYTVGEVTGTGTAQDPFTCKVTLNTQPYADQYSSDVKTTHSLAAEQAASVDINLTWNGTAWQAPTGETLATINVECDEITIVPADITIYMGGDGYSSVVSGTTEEGKVSDGLPTPGYLVTLPSWMNKKYFNGQSDAQDLTEKIRFVYDGNNDGQYNDPEKDRIWELERYSAEGTSQTGEDGVGRYVYRLDADTLAQQPVRLQFTDEAGNTTTSDDFTPNSDKLYATYHMTIYPGLLDKGAIKAQVMDGGVAKETVASTVGKGTLTIRGTDEETSVITPVGSSQDDVAQNTKPVDEQTGSTITALQTDPNTQYYINHSHVSVQPDHVQLLTNGLLEDKEPLDNYLQQQAYADKDSQILYQYMDLVDKSNGNAQVTSTQPMAIYWKLPKNADPDKEITLVHFEGLDRDYSGADLEGELAKANVQVFSTTPDQEAGEEALTKETIHGETYLKFTVSTFSPFALIWQNKQGGNPDPTYYYKLHYEPNGGTVYQDEWYTYNTLVQLTKVPSREGYTFTGWYADKDLTQKITDVRMTSHKTVYAGWRATNVPDWLNGTDHFAYVVGYPDGNVKPMANISRAEVATIFFRLLKEEVRDANLTTTNNFEDVNEGYWCNAAVSTMAKLGIIEGRTATTFDPEAPITRAEFAAICARFETSKVEGGNSFTDIAGHWAEEEIKRAAALGWILGYEDDTFHPENKITRAEAMTMFNRVLNRLPEEESDLLEGMRVWPDNQPGTWYYLAVQEATNSHNYKHKGEIYETWTELTEDPDWSQYE